MASHLASGPPLPFESGSITTNALLSGGLIVTLRGKNYLNNHPSYFNKYMINTCLIICHDFHLSKTESGDPVFIIYRSKG